MPNYFAYIALTLWPLVTILLYKRLPTLEATFWTIVGGFLFLPVKVAIDFPFIPPMDKESITVISALIGCRFIKKEKIKLIPKMGTERWLVLILIFMPVITVLNNQETVNYIPALTLHDTLSLIVNQYFILIPFILGLQLIKTHEDVVLLFRLLVVAGLVYSIPILFEVKMSPQLHTWIYGFFPHSFLQQFRYDGFRPVVFLGHGLIVAMFVAIVLGAAAVLMKEKIRSFRFFSPKLTVIYFFILLLLCKTVGAFVLGAFLFAVITWMPTPLVKRTSLFLVAVFLLYPFLSIFDYFPHQELIQIANDYDPVRGESLAFRFYNEGLLLQHANTKMFFGWGGWGRNRLEGSTTDGYWIIYFGQFGLVGFLSLFGLLALSIWNACKASSILRDKNKKRLLIFYALIISIVMIDQIPNASLSAWMFFLSGSLLGYSRNIMLNDRIIKKSGLKAG